MPIKRGNVYKERSGAKNFIHEEAQRRLNETVRPFNSQVINALNVDAVECNYYSVNDKTGRPCSCQKQGIVHSHAEQGNNVAIEVPEDDNGNSFFSMVLQDGFGEPAEKHVIDVSGEMPIPSTEADFEEGMLSGNSVNCGICHRIGFQPAYQLYGKQRTLLTHFDIEEMRGFQVEYSEQPHRMKRVTDDGYVEYKINVPANFKAVFCRVYENHAHVPILPTLRNGMPVDLLFFKQCAGHETVIRVHRNHTHVVFEFDLGLPPLKVNISGEQKTIDYDRMETMSDITVVLPPTITEVNAKDIIIVPDRRLALKVNDKERKITADKRLLEWVVQTRVLQPTEQIRRIGDLRRLL